MYAVFRSGGKQYRGKEGDKIKLEKINADEGSSVQFDEVMILGEGDNIKIGTNVYDLLKYKNVIFTSTSVKLLQERLSKWKNLIIMM